MSRTRALLALLFICPAAAQAQGFFVGDPGAGPVSMAAGVVAYPENVSIAPYNPAGLVRVKDGVIGDIKFVNFNHAVYFRQGDEHCGGCKRYAGEELDNKRGIGGPFLAVADNLGTEKWKFAYSVHVQFGSKLDFDENGVQRYMMKKVDLEVFDNNFSAGYAINDHWSVGGALIFVKATVKEDVDLDLQSLLDPTKQPSELPENRIPTNVDLDDTGFTGNVGILYDSDKWKFGMLYQAKTTLDLKGDVRTDLSAISPGLKALLGVGDELTLKANMTLKLPQYARIGAAFHAADHWWVTGEFFWIDWSTLESFDVELAPNPINVTSYVIPRHWDDGYALKLGADHKINDHNRLRFGTFAVKAPTKRQYVQLDIPDNNREGFTVGYQHRFHAPLTLDVSYAHQWLKSWHIEDSRQNPRVNGDIEVNFGALLTSLTWNF